MGINFYSDIYDDIAWHDPTTQQIGSWDMDSGVATSWIGSGYSSPWSPISLGNYIGGTTSSTDILWINQSTGDVGVWEIVNGAFASWTWLGTAGGGWQPLGTGSTGSMDFTGDGYDDLLWGNLTTGQIGIWDISNGAATWQSLGYTSGNWFIAGAGDVVGDSKDDIIWQDSTTGGVGAWHMSNGTAEWTYLGFAGAGWEIMGTGDFTNDGLGDILWGNFSTGSWGIWDGSASGFTWIGGGYFDSANWYLAGIGDYTGDGQDDLLWQSNDGHVGYADTGGGNSLTSTWTYLGYAGADWFAT